MLGEPADFRPAVTHRQLCGPSLGLLACVMSYQRSVICSSLGYFSADLDFALKLLAAKAMDKGTRAAGSPCSERLLLSRVPGLGASPSLTVRLRVGGHPGKEHEKKRKERGSLVLMSSGQAALKLTSLERFHFSTHRIGCVGERNTIFSGLEMLRAHVRARGPKRGSSKVSPATSSSPGA